VVAYRSRNNIAREIDEFKLRIVKARTISCMPDKYDYQNEVIDVLSRTSR